METVGVIGLVVLVVLLLGPVVVRGVRRILMFSAWAVAIGGVCGVGIWGPVVACAMVLAAALVIIGGRRSRRVVAWG